MFYVRVTLILSAILMTQSTQIDDDIVDKTPLSETLYIFDVTSDAPVDDIISSLSPVEQLVKHKFQVIGEPRYYFVVVNDQSEAVREIAFPVGSTVTQYPAEHSRDYLKLFGVEGWNTSDTDDHMFVNKDLTICERDFFENGESNATALAESIKTYGEALRNAADLCHCATYFVVGRYPPKHFVFLNQADNVSNKIGLHALDLGITGKVTYRHLRLI